MLELFAMRAVVVILSFASCAALPGDDLIRSQLQAIRENNTNVSACNAKECKKPAKKYERILNAQPGMQWGDAGGYCGSWSIQRATMAKGAWISQQQVRNHTEPGGGHDNEILATNIDLALKNLKIKAEGFDYQHLQTPQVDSYRKWIKKQLAAGNPVVWMIMLTGGHYPVYPNLPYGGVYSHVEPVVGILSDHPLDDETLYDDDVIVHYTDADTHAYYRTMDSLPGDYFVLAKCPGADYLGYPCINKKYGFGWAVKGFLDEKEGFPLSLTLDKWESEPDTRSGRQPTQLTGTVSVEGLSSGQKYAIYRWDDVQSAFDYSQSHSVHRFTATAQNYTFTDKETFSSAGATYYRCIPDDDAVVVV